MKRIFTYIAAISCMLLAVSCEDHRNDYMEEYQTMVYFRDGGDQSIDLYRTGDDGWYTISICKAGRNLEGTISVELIPFDDSRINLYNAANFTSLTAVPRTMYSFYQADETTLITDNPITLDFAANEPYKILKLRMDTNSLKARMDANPEKNYVIGMQLFSAMGKVSEDNNLLMLKPSVSVPYLSISNTGVYSYALTKKSNPDPYENRVKFGVDRNNWAFDCNLEVQGAEWLNAYNTSHGTDYELLDSKFYSLPDKLSFAKGDKESKFAVTVKPKIQEGETVTMMPSLRNFVIPVCVKNAEEGGKEKTEFEPYRSEEENDYAYILKFVMTPDSLSLKPEQITAFYDGKADYTKDLLVDGNDKTCWASPGSTRFAGNIPGDPEWGFWFNIDLGSKPLDAFVLGYCASNRPERCPTRIRIGVSNDGTHFTEVLNESQVNMRFLKGWYDLPLVKLSQKVRYIRFGLLETYHKDTVYPLNTDDVDMTCEVAEIRLYGDAN